MTPVVLGACLFALVGAMAFIPLEAWFGHGGGDARRHVRTAAICAALFLLNSVLMRWLGDPVIAEIDARGIDLVLPTWARIAVAFVLADLVAYWQHRAMHRIPLLWRFHRLHHSSRELRFWEAWRQHPIDFVSHGIAVAIPAALLGISLSDMVGLVLARKVFTLYLHADLPWRHGRLSGLLASPAWHKIHHSPDPRDHDRNFAGTFPWIDRLFGTDRPA